MGELTSIGFIPGCSAVHRLDPRTKQGLLIGLSMLSLGGTPLFLFLLNLASFWGLHCAGIRLRRLVIEIRYFLVFLGAIFCVRTFIFSGGWLPVFDGAAAGEALMVCWRLLTVVLMGLLLMATTRMAHIRAALVWYFKPIPLVDEKMAATMVGLVVRFLPLILMQAADISDAQRARGIDRRKNPLVRLMRFSIPLFQRVFLSADELVAAMQARCYSEQRTLPDLTFTQLDLLALAAATLASLTLLLP